MTDQPRKAIIRPNIERGNRAGQRFILHSIPGDLWARVKARAARETAPGEPFNLESKIVRLLGEYARLGLAEMLRRCHGPVDGLPSDDSSTDSETPADASAAPRVRR